MKAKILVADDDPEFVDLLRRRLESEEYDVVCAYEGAGTLEKARKEKPKLILLDWKMPIT